MALRVKSPEQLLLRRQRLRMRIRTVCKGVMMQGGPATEEGALRVGLTV